MGLGPPSLRRHTPAAQCSCGASIACAGAAATLFSFVMKTPRQTETTGPETAAAAPAPAEETAVDQPLRAMFESLKAAPVPSRLMRLVDALSGSGRRTGGGVN